MVLRRSILILTANLLLAACSGSSEQAPSDQPRPATSAGMQVGGSVFDGPVVGADLVIRDVAGQVLGQIRSDGRARYDVSVPAETSLPILVTAVAGTDLVTGRPLDFTLRGASFASGRVTVNVSPLTTVAVLGAQCMGEGLTRQTLDAAWQRVHGDLGMGLDPRRLPDPMSIPVSGSNIEALVLANEALGEAVRRSHQALAGSGLSITTDGLLNQVACDLMGQSQQRSGAPVDARVMAAFKAAELAVRLETLAGRLEVDGYSATDRMNDSIRQVMPGFSDPSVAGVPATDEARAQTLALVSMLAPVAGSALLPAAAALRSAPADELRARLDAALDTRLQGVLQALLNNLPLADDGVVSELSERRIAFDDQMPPTVSLAAQPSEVPAGGITTLSWAVSNADMCAATGGWTGTLPHQGVRRSDPLQQRTRFDIVCVGPGGTTSRSVTVSVENEVVMPPVGPDPAPAPSPMPAPDPTAPLPVPGPTPTPTPEPEPGPVPAPQPTVSLAAASDPVPSGASATLNWSSAHASTCTASGGWSGTRPTGGTATVGPLTAQTTFSLTCSGDGGNAMAMISVAVTAPVSLNWRAPTQNVDGSPLTNLAGYRIHYGTSSRNYSNAVALNNPAATSFAATLPSGTYYLAMTAVDGQGNESGFSNEVVRTVD